MSDIESHHHIINVATRVSLSLFCLMYLTFAKGNEAFNRRVSRFVYPVMEISESGTQVPGDIAASQYAICYERKTNEEPSNGDSQHHHHRHHDSSRFAHDHIAIGQRAPTVSRALAPMRFRVGQRAASRLGADLHAKLLEKLETLYPLLRRVPAEIHPYPSLTISGRTTRRTLVLSSSQTSNPPYQRHVIRLYHI